MLLASRKFVYRSNVSFMKVMSSALYFVEVRAFIIDNKAIINKDDPIETSNKIMTILNTD